MTISAFPLLLSMAEKHGWTPQGTEHPGRKAWGGGYGTNDGQIVTEADARALAQALRRALRKIPEERATGGPDVWLPYPYVQFSGENKDFVRSFIVFCEAGAFRIR